MRMKKTYLQPGMVVHRVCTSSPLLGLSGNFKEGETGHVGVSDDDLQGDALVKQNDWEDIWD